MPGPWGTVPGEYGMYAPGNNLQLSACFTTPASGGPTRLSRFRPTFSESSATSVTFSLYAVSSNWATYITPPLASDVVEDPLSCAAGLNTLHYERALALPNIYAAVLSANTNYCLGLASVGFTTLGFLTCSAYTTAAVSFDNGLLVPSGTQSSAILNSGTGAVATFTSAGGGCLAATFA